MKYDSEVRNIQKEAIVTVSKVTELFLTFLTSKAYQITTRKKRKTIKDSDLIEAIHSQELFKFLQNDFPKQVGNIKRNENIQEDLQEKNTNSNTNTTMTASSVRKYFKPQITEFNEHSEVIE